MCVGNRTINSGAGQAVPAQGSPGGMVRGIQFLSAYMAAANGNSGPLAAMKAQFRNNHGGMNVKQVVQARRAQSTTGQPTTSPAAVMTLGG